VTRYVDRIKNLLDGLDLETVERTVGRLRAIPRDRTVFVAGNGGSAATASHWANDIVTIAERSGRGPARVTCLSDNASAVTALANDEGFELVFSRQLERCAAPGDILVVISASGNSPNLIRSVEVARERDVHTVGLIGFDGGVLRDLVDEAIWIRSEIGEYGLVESVHAVVCDMITSCLAGDAALR
jgi:D-sedoheptulose 7-phosphate isomerase